MTNTHIAVIGIWILIKIYCRGKCEITAVGDCVCTRLYRHSHLNSMGDSGSFWWRPIKNSDGLWQLIWLCKDLRPWGILTSIGACICKRYLSLVQEMSTMLIHIVSSVQLLFQSQAFKDCSKRTRTLASSTYFKVTSLRLTCWSCLSIGGFSQEHLI